MNRAALIRKLLRDPENSDGMTNLYMGEILGCPANQIWKVVRKMPDTHIDRWVPPQEGDQGGNWAAVWCIVTPPPDCPRPNKKGARR